MRLSKLFTKTLREAPKDEESINAKLLIRGGFIFKNSAGVYTFFSLGWRVIEKILKIVDEEMDAVGGEKISMPALVEKKYWDATGRWDVDIGFEVRGKKEKESNFTLGWSHEDILSFMASKFINSYKDLPKAVYQFQTKFRNEPRAKSGLLRGREFLMKDLYSFHESEKDLFRYYDSVKQAYFKIFERCGLKTIYTLAGGGAFTISNTHEFQVLSDVGEDTVFICLKCEYAENSEISKLKDGGQCSKCGGFVQEKKSIEVGNIFPLGLKYSEAFGLKYLDKDGGQKHVVMGSYGIGISRLMGTIVEIHNDGIGILWPENVAPFKVHLIALNHRNQEAGKIYEDLQNAGVEVLYDDRLDQSPGEKFADADLIGCPFRVIVSEKTLEKDSVEFKKRAEDKSILVNLNKLSNQLR
ncbi:MAG: aminoacyl--tRNA ligase-related protein [Patescibacteria group bacterium]